MAMESSRVIHPQASACGVEFVKTSSLSTCIRRRSTSNLARQHTLNDASWESIEQDLSSTIKQSQHEVRFARTCRAKNIPRVDKDTKRYLYYSQSEILAFSHDYQEERNGLFVVFQILSGAKETPVLEDLL